MPSQGMHVGAGPLGSAAEGGAASAGGLASYMDVDGSLGGGDGLEAKAETARIEAEKWKNLANAMHTFVVDQVLVPSSQ